MKKQIDNDEIKTVLLGLLEEFDYICRKNDLKYSLCGGTLLGAIRHKGFIPWDDDVDVFMLREEYDKFLACFKRTRHKKYIKILNYFSRGYTAPFCKIVDTRTYSEENKRTEKLGVWIDLHVIDLMPTKDISFYSGVIRSLNEIRFLGSKSYFSKDGKSPISAAIKNLIKFLIRPIKKRRERNKIESFIKNNHGDQEISFSFGDKVKFWCSIQNLNFNDLIEVNFENLKVMCLKNYDVYMKAKYGDYMSIPKPEDRILHDVRCCYWK